MTLDYANLYIIIQQKLGTCICSLDNSKYNYCYEIQFCLQNINPTSWSLSFSILQVIQIKLGQNSCCVDKVESLGIAPYSNYLEVITESFDLFNIRTYTPMTSQSQIILWPYNIHKCGFTFGGMYELHVALLETFNTNLCGIHTTYEATLSKNEWAVDTLNFTPQFTICFVTYFKITLLRIKEQYFFHSITSN